MDTARHEIRVMAELTALAAGHHPYTEIVDAVLDLVERVVASPFLALAVREPRGIGQYGRTDDSTCANEVQFRAEEVQRQILQHHGPIPLRSEDHRMLAPPAWLRLFPAETRSGRAATLVLGAPHPLTLSPWEDALMLRLAQHVLLVIDHVLLVESLEGIEATDPLTGVASYRRLMEMLEYEIPRHRYSGKRLSLMLLDVEGLGAINRSYGTGYGNHILQKVAVLLQAAVRPIDLVARCGHDEFAVLMPETEEDGRELAERLRQEILRAQFAGGTISASVAMAHVKPDEMLTAEHVLRRAERKLFEAKRRDRDWGALWGT
ncbi:MAG: GGDEF domain-containing protein [Chloroflexota bacterium]|nr:GGDEF domain-containing protein [Chloroflexota bacterium]